jgi:ribosomal protein L37AE/L43A
VDSIDVKDMSKDNGDDKNDIEDVDKDNNDIEDVDKDNNDIEDVDKDNNDIEDVDKDNNDIEDVNKNAIVDVINAKIFKCDDCNKVFKAKQNLNNHIANNTCKKAFKCQHCNKGFTTKANMHTHIRTTCEVKKKDNKEKNDICGKIIKIEEKHKKLQDSMLEKNKKLQEMILERDKKSNDQINALKSKITSMEKNTKKGINNGNDNHNITMIGHGEEDLSKIDKNEILQAIKHGHDSITKLTEVLYFNPKQPEYNNIYITNMKDKYAMMFDGSDWILTMKNDLINKIYNDIKDYIEENINTFANLLSASEREALERWFAIEDHDKRILKVKEDMKLLLYNKRNVILDKKTKLKE